MKIDQIESVLLQLPQHDRARLAERLIASLEGEGEVEEAWYNEAERLLGEIQTGEAETATVEEVFASLRAILKE